MVNGHFALTRLQRLNLALLLGLVWVLGLLGFDWPLRIVLAMTVAGTVVGVRSVAEFRGIARVDRWRPGALYGAAVLMGLSAALFLGLPGTLFAQGYATRRLKRYGLRDRFTGLDRDHAVAILEELRRREARLEA